VKKNNSKIRIIHWRDHHSDDTWKSLDEIKEWATKPKICTSRGILTYEDDEIVVLSSSDDGEGNFGENMCILKKNIIK
jgi:hypothetical protein